MLKIKKTYLFDWVSRQFTLKLKNFLNAFLTPLFNPKINEVVTQFLFPEGVLLIFLIFAHNI